MFDHTRVLIHTLECNESHSNETAGRGEDDLEIRGLMKESEGRCQKQRVDDVRSRGQMMWNRKSDDAESGNDVESENQVEIGESEE